MYLDCPIVEADLNAASSEASTALASSWAGWAVSSLTSKFYRSKTPTSSVTSNKSINSTSLADPINKEAGTKTPLSKSESHESVDNPSVWGNIADEETAPSGKESGNDWGDGEGWDDFDNADESQDVIVDSGERRASLKSKTTNNEKSNKNGHGHGHGWDEQGAAWDSLAKDKGNEKRPSTPPALVDKDHGSTLAGQMKQRPTTDKKKESVSGPGTANPAGQAKAKAKKGPMKLGAQKIS